MAARRAIKDAVRRHPEQAAAALDAIQRDHPNPLSLDGVRVAAGAIGEACFEDLLISLLRARGDLKAYAIALGAHGALLQKAPLNVRKQARDITSNGFNVPVSILEDFIPKSRRMSCRIKVGSERSGSEPAGSGWLVGPSLIMTAWHVVGLSSAAPDGAERRIEVVLSNGRTLEALATPVYESPCTPDERIGEFPHQDSAYDGFNDVALLRLTRPEGVRIGYRPLDPPATPLFAKPVLLFHFPDAQDRGVGFAQLMPTQPLSARWEYDAPARSGSSGGACFDLNGKFLGIHSARTMTARRLVPGTRFLDAIRPFVENDIAPRFLWRLDADIVIGRDQFFEAVSLASKPKTRIRGLRVKRLDSEAQGSDGLAFSRIMLERLLERDPGAHRVIAVNFDAPHDDLLGEIARRSASEAESVSVSSGADPGLGTGEASAQAAMKARAEALAHRLSDRAEGGREGAGTGAPGAGQLWWFFFENAARSLSAQELMGLEQFAAAAIRQPNLRIVIAGFELVQTPGPELNGIRAGEEGEPGFMVEIFGSVERRDIEHVLQLASAEFGASLGPLELEIRTRDILKAAKGSASINGRYAFASVATIKAAIAADLPRLLP